VTNKLLDFGHSFQIKIIASLMINSQFLSQIYDILDEKHFDSDSLRWIVERCKKYFIDYKKPITLDAFKVEVGDIDNDVLKTTVLEHLKEIFRFLTAPDLEFIQDKALDFFKNQALKGAILQSVDILERSSDFDQIKTLIDDAMKAGTERDVGHEYINDIEDRYSETARSTVETGWPVIDELMQGGLGHGELGVVVAPAGIGKCIGGDTKIEIQYEDIGFNITDELTLWFKPWDMIYVNDNLQLTASDVSILLSRVGIGKTS